MQRRKPLKSLPKRENVRSSFPLSLESILRSNPPLFPDCTDRTQRLKGAREEASKEVDSLKKKKDDEFKQFESQVRSPFSSPPFSSVSSCIILPHEIALER